MEKQYTSTHNISYLNNQWHYQNYRLMLKILKIVKDLFIVEHMVYMKKVFMLTQRRDT